MKTVGVSELRNNIKKYLDLAEKEVVIIHRGKGCSFAIVPTEPNEESPYNREFVASMLDQGREASKNGKRIKVALEDLVK